MPGKERKGVNDVIAMNAYMHVYLIDWRVQNLFSSLIFFFDKNFAFNFDGDHNYLWNFQIGTYAFPRNKLT